MKKKFLVFTLCFTLIFSSLNYKKSYADGGIISLPMVATVSALAVGANIIINNSDNLYDLGRMFYDYIDRHNDLTWSTVQSLFASSVALHPNKFVSVDSKFLDIVKDFFDTMFNDTSEHVYVNGVPNRVVVANSPGTNRIFTDNGVSINLKYSSSASVGIKVKFPDGTEKGYDGLRLGTDKSPVTHFGYQIRNANYLDILYSLDGGVNYFSSHNIYSPTASFGGLVGNTFPYKGGYTWDNVESKKENDSISLPIPGHLGQLVGQTSDEFWDNTDNLVGQGGLNLPEVDDPSISVDTSTNTFPGADSDIPDVDSPSVPNEGIWSTIKDFIIGLVVPSDTFWTDTWGGLYNNFTNSFPMVDMDGFNDLVTGEKKFPNIDINIMGVTGRVVNGDVINSIVDWLRPIIAGFMMLCLMLFNYRKIYKLIRNSEPFGGIAPGTSDFSTGISEYSKQEVVKATDMVAEYRAWKERGGK